MRQHDQLKKEQDLHIRKVGLNLVDWLFERVTRQKGKTEKSTAKI